jgi:hypothetical protein
MSYEKAIKQNQPRTAIILLRLMQNPSEGDCIVWGTLHDAENYNPDVQGIHYDTRSSITSHQERVAGKDSHARAAREKARKDRVVRELQAVAKEYPYLFRALRVYDATRSSKPKLVSERRLSGSKVTPEASA